MFKKIEQIFDTEFPTITIECRSRSFGGGDLYAFILIFQNESDLKELWKVVSNTIAVAFQSQLKDEFAKWNTYLFYSIDFDITRELKYEIENNKFSSRKIIIERKLISTDVIEEYIFDKSLKEAMSIPVVQTNIFTKKNIIQNALKNKTVREKRVKKEVALEVLDDLYEALKEDNNEV